jgi:hypothetical protein
VGNEAYLLKAIEEEKEFAAAEDGSLEQERER